MAPDRPQRAAQPVGSKAGFTMVELLVAVVLMSVLLVMVLALFRFLQDSAERIDGGRHRERAARIVLDRLEQELTGAMLVRRAEGSDPLAHPWLFYGVDSTIDGDDADQLRFVTQTPLRGPGERFGRGVRLVTYALDLDTEGRRVLLRREEPLPDQLEKAIDVNDAQVVARDVHSFDLAYAGSSGGDWDSTSVQQSDQLPEVVEVRVSLLERLRDGQLVPGTLAYRTIELPTRPEYFDPPDGSGAGACETGASVAECREPWLAIITQLEDALTTEDMETSFAAVTDACWQSDDPSDELYDLQLYIKASIVSLDNPEVPDCPLP